MHKKIGLNNGLQIILKHMPGRESVAMGIWIRVGSRHEDKPISGISHFLEHMLFKGTPSRNNRAIKEEIEGRGGSLNAFTSEEMTCYLAKVSARHADIALEVLSDMVLNASLDTRDVEREKAVITEEIKMYKDLPSHHVHDILGELMWPKNPLGFPIAGDDPSVRSITRKKLTAYKKINYIPDNIAFVLCGNLDRDSVAKKIKKIFSHSVKTNIPPIVRFNKTQKTPGVSLLCKKTEQTRLCMGLHAFDRTHKDRFVLELIHIILGANMSSRLFENVREKRGLAYDIGTDVKLYSDTGAFVISAGIDHRKADEAVGLIVKELRKIKQNLASADELKRAKEYAKVQLSMALESTTNHMLWLGEHVVMTGNLPDKKNILKKIDAVSLTDIKRVSGGIFTAPNANLAIIGPLKDENRKHMEKELERL